jgi:hypothetical protein
MVTTMAKKWAVARKTINVSQQTADALAALVAATGKTETEIFNEAVQELAAKIRLST